MKKKIAIKLELNKHTIAKLDHKAMRKIKGGVGGSDSTDRNSKGADCSAVCCASDPTDS